MVHYHIFKRTLTCAWIIYSGLAFLLATPSCAADDLNALLDTCYDGGKYGYSVESIESSCVKLRQMPNIDATTVADTYNTVGLIRYNQQKYEEAIKEFEASFKYVPNYRFTLNNKGLSLVALKRCDESLKVYTESAKLYPDVGSSLYGIAESLKCLKRYDEALKYYSDALVISPHMDAYYKSRSRILLITGDAKGAFEDMEAAARLDPRENNYLLWAAQSAEIAGDFAAAKKYIEKYVAAEPKAFYGFFERYLLGLRDNKDDKKAVTDFSANFPDKNAWIPKLLEFIVGSLSVRDLEAKAKSIGTDDPSVRLLDCYYVNASLLLVRGDRAGARGEFQKAVDLNRLDYAQHYYSLGWLKQLAGG